MKILICFTKGRSVLIMKKIFSVIICMLMIFSTVTIILYSGDEKVKASGGEPTGDGVGLNDTYIWNQTVQFAHVIYYADWSGSENNIPKGRSWATAGEEFTIDNRGL